MREGWSVGACVEVFFTSAIGGSTGDRHTHCKLHTYIVRTYMYVHWMLQLYVHILCTCTVESLKDTSLIRSSQ